jgi:hypothetical protein
MASAELVHRKSASIKGVRCSWDPKRSLSAPRVAPYNWTRGAEAVPTTWVNGFDSESRDLNRALDGLVTLQVSGEQKLLPIWHEITKDEVMTTSPSLADKIARSTTQHIIEEIATEIASVVRPDLALTATAGE